MPARVAWGKPTGATDVLASLGISYLVCDEVVASLSGLTKVK